MLQSYLEGANDVDVEMQAAIRRGYVPVRRAGNVNTQLGQSLLEELERALDRVLEYEELDEESGRDSSPRALQIIRYLQKQAYLTGAATRRADFGENLVLVVLRRTGTEDCARYVGRVFVDDVYSSGEMYQTPRGYSSWHAVTGRFMRRTRYPLLSEAIAGGLYHYGCKCWHISYFDGVTQTDYQGERLPSFVDFDPGFDGSFGEDDALYAVRSYLNQQNINPSAMRGFWTSRNVHYQRNVPASLDERIRQYLVYILGEEHGDTHEAYFIYHNLLNILAAQMLLRGDFDPTSISNEEISSLLTNLLAGRSSSGRNSMGQSFGGINDMSSYAEFRRLYAFLQNFDDASSLDVAFVVSFFRYMDNHSDVSLTNISQSNVRISGARVVVDFLNGISDEEAMFLFLSYVWATNSGRTYEQSRAMFSFGQAGAGIILGAAGAMATGAASAGAVRGISTTTRHGNPGRHLEWPHEHGPRASN